MTNNELIIIVIIVYTILLFRNYFRYKKINKLLKEKDDNLELILNSTAEGIYGIDKNGNCTFCNASCLEILGYNDESELLGKNMHLQVHHSYRDGKSMSADECKIYKALKVGKGTHADDEVFWTADGTSFDVEYRSYPEFKDGKVIGAVVTFMDITERKKAYEEILYLSYHDILTGLYNKVFLEAELERLDTQRNLPISIIIGDANGLKLTNDVFGHAAGDKLLKKVADAIKRACREDDIIARIGGDEFIVLLPKTTGEDAEKIIKRIKNEISKEQILAIKPSISMGSSTKTSINQDIASIIEDAEGRMYQEKTLDRKTNSTSQIKTIIETLHEKYPREKQHSINVRRLCKDIGMAMNLPNEEIKILMDAGYLHDIGKIVLSDKIMKKEEPLTEKETKEFRQHSVVGYRILNSFDETLDLAGPVLAHHERWDGSGYPKGLESCEIPHLSRIIAVAESYDSMTNELNKNILSKEEAIQRIKSQSGKKFDPDVVDAFISIMI